MNINSQNWNHTESIQLINEIRLSRNGIPKERADYWIMKMEEAKEDTEKRIYPQAMFGIQFDRHLLELFREDKRIKNYKWWYARHRTKHITVDKYLQVYDAIIDYFKNAAR